eukprot:364834-Chlamydomonas_euryale.AAC.9
MESPPELGRVGPELGCVGPELGRVGPELGCVGPEHVPKGGRRTKESLLYTYICTFIWPATPLPCAADRCWTTLSPTPATPRCRPLQTASSQQERKDAQSNLSARV